MDIVANGNFMLLLTRGRLPESYLLDVWEGIIKANEAQNGGRKHQHYFRLYQAYVKILSDYTYNRLLLLKLTFTYTTWNAVEAVRERGFKIDTENKIVFALSIKDALTKNENLLTKIQMKEKELKKIVSPDDGARIEKSETFEDLIAFLEINGFKPDYSITLKQFNANVNLIKKKHAAMESNKTTNRPSDNRANRKARHAA